MLSRQRRKDDLLHLNNLSCRLFFVSTINYRNYRLSKIYKCQSRHAVAIGSSRFSVVATLANTLNERYLCQQRHVKFLGEFLASLFTEDVITVFGQFLWRKPSHILYQSEDGHVYFFVLIHINTLASIGKSHLLRCRDNDSTSN